MAGLFRSTHIMSQSSAPSGILLLDKPSGITSNGALGRAKRILGIRKAGHTGTLDPMASGLLVLCFGEATKVSAFLLDADKTYRAELHLGVQTDSEDAEGAVIAECEVPELDVPALESVLERFRGNIEQVPPMHSALKHQGQRLYELARRGEHVERPPRAVTIHELTLNAIELPRLQLTVRCSKGTYIRSLARDIGSALGCGAHLCGLRRTASAPFEVADAVPLDRLDGLDREPARALLLPPDTAIAHLPKILLDDEQAARLRQGQKLAGLEAGHEGLVRVYAADGFAGIGEMDGAGRLKPKRLLNPPAS
jgi:tRNA pseudouridine55 synthase